MDLDEKRKPLEIDYHYIRTSNYRSFHVDGAFGGLTPRGYLYMDLYFERSPTPERIRHTIKETGELGGEIERESKKGLIREIECGLMMDIDTAKVLRDWIDGKITMYETRSRKDGHPAPTGDDKR